VPAEPIACYIQQSLMYTFS